MYFHNAPDEKQFYDETIRLVTDLHYFDVLRCDKSTANIFPSPLNAKGFVNNHLHLHHRKYKMPKNFQY